MKRRGFIKYSTLGVIATNFNCSFGSKVSHTISLSFDDGFKKSFYKIAEIYEEFGMQACFNVIATGHFPDFKQVDDWILPKLMGSFDDWNALQDRGHEIMPHSWKHLNLRRQPLDEAKELIVKCLDYFEAHLDNFNPSEAVFNFPFNASSEALDAFCLSHVKAVRTSSSTPFNIITTTKEPVRLGCATNGPTNNDAWMEDEVDRFLEDEKGGWMVLNLHGLDEEGWGPISEGYLHRLLSRLSKLNHVAVKPVGAVLG